MPISCHPEFASLILMEIYMCPVSDWHKGLDMHFWAPYLKKGASSTWKHSEKGSRMIKLTEKLPEVEWLSKLQIFTL